MAIVTGGTVGKRDKAAGLKVYTLTEKLYLDRDGNVVDAKSKLKRTLLGEKGTVIPIKRAEELGLVGGPAKNKQVAQDRGGETSA